jgi:hypothetical protein
MAVIFEDHHSNGEDAYQRGKQPCASCERGTKIRMTISFVYGSCLVMAFDQTSVRPSPVGAH